MHDAMNATPTPEKPSNSAASTALIVRFDLSKVLTAEELTSFAQQAKAAGRTIREHFLAITIQPQSKAS